MGAEGGIRTPMPFRAQRPERCVSTSFTTSACVCLWDVDYNTASHQRCQEDCRPFLQFYLFARKALEKN